MVIPYCEEIKAKKLEEAIRRGYIIRHQDPDGTLRYELTHRGVEKWLLERIGIV